MVRTKFHGATEPKFTRRKGKKPGRPNTFDPALKDKAYKMALYGLSEKQMYEVLDIKVNTWNKWKRDFPDFQKAIDDGRIHANFEVAHALYKRAVGYERDENHISVTPKGQVVVTPTKKYFPPDMKAVQMWLTNKSRGLWHVTHHHKVEHAGEIRHRQEQVDLRDFSTEELKILKKYSVLQN